MTEIVAIPAFNDNYIWMAVDRDRRSAVVVDPGDAAPVTSALEAADLKLTAILVTHHHHDHTGGVQALAEAHGVPVFGPADEPIPARTHPLREGDQVDVPDLDLSLHVLEVPGHTAGHIALVGKGLVFAGDTLFAGGCGRIFEGTPEQMFSSLQKLSDLPDDTLVYAGHEYTLANLRFALKADPDNAALAERLRMAEATRAQDRPTLPSRLADERATNPFLRAHQPALQASAERWADAALDQPVAVFAALRRWKDQG